MFETKKLVIVGLALALPGSILGVFLGSYALVEKKIISNKVALLVVVLVVINTFYLMLKYAKNKSKKN